MAIFVNRESLTTKSRHVTLTWMDKDENQRVVASSDSLPVIDVNHLRMHEGRAYYVYKHYPYTAGLAAGASVDISISWPAGVAPHAVFAYGSSGETEFFVYENAIIVGGTAMTMHRRNRTITAVSSGSPVLAPTVNNVGTELYAEFISANNKGGGSESYTFEYVLKPETQYLFRLTNVNSQAHPATLRIEWYE